MTDYVLWRSKQPPRYRVLQYLAKVGQATKKEIVAHTKLDVVDPMLFLTSCLPKMAQAGLLDKPSKMVFRITDKGREAAKKHDAAKYYDRSSAVRRVTELAGQLPVPEIAKKVGKLDRKRVQALLNYRLDVSYKVEFSEYGVTIAELIRLLKRRKETIYKLRDRGLKVRREQRYGFVYFEDLREWAKASKRNEYIFWGCDAYDLELLLGDQQWAQELSRLPRVVGPGRVVAVQRIDTGRIYPSYKSASVDNFIHHSTIQLAISRARKMGMKRFTCCGVDWRLIE